MPPGDGSAIGDRIRLARRAAGLTQASLAAVIGVTQRSVQLYESGDVVPYRRLGEIAEVCGCTPQWLLYGDRQRGSRVEGGDALRERLSDRVRSLERQLEALQENVRVLGELRPPVTEEMVRRRRPTASPPAAEETP